MKLNLDEIEAYCEKALKEEDTPGVYLARMEFALRARTDLPLAVKELREAREERGEARALLRLLLSMLENLPEYNHMTARIHDCLNATKGELDG